MRSLLNKTKTLPLDAHFVFSLYYFLNVGLFAFYIALVPLYLVEKSFTLELIAYHSLFATLAYMLSGSCVMRLLNTTFTPERAVICYSILAPISFGLFLLAEGTYALIITWALFFFIRFGSHTIIDSELIAQTESGKLRFEKARLWGSIGFIVFGALFGLTTEVYGIKFTAYIAFFILCFQATLSSLATAFFTHLEITPSTGFFSQKMLPHKNLIFLFAAVALNWLAHAPMYTYLSVYFEELGWRAQHITLAWNIGVVAETIIFLLFFKLESLFSLKKLLIISTVLMMLRWIILYSTENFYILLASQSLHAFSFGSSYLCVMRLAHKLSPSKDKSKAQGALTFFGFGFGSLIGRVLLILGSSYIITKEDIAHLFLYAALCSVVTVVFCFMIPEEKKAETL